MADKITAVSMNRYRATAEQRRRYGGATITEFSVGREGSPASTWRTITGFGPTPGDRKSDAIRRFLAAESTPRPENPPAPRPFEPYP